MGSINLPVDSPLTYVVLFAPVLIILLWPGVRWGIKGPFALLALFLSWLAALAFFVVIYRRGRDGGAPGARTSSG